ncbi:cupin domain-containing protein [Oceanobacillus polygoni]|uniref:Cupin superfamily protein n=1 Tax=Oceanobacillus polygoni TaxID=1235259 RepID=A0A9X1CCX7_9BACI|nr:cupin domain-containing protein [Oceanobacillus polygoni]MBP2078461.1 putative cupin superfamily protein [Oceanobacillus polygoni]
MSEKTASQTKYNYLSQNPGVQLIKAGTYEPKRLTNKSQIIDVPVSSNENQVQLGYFNMQPGEEFEFVYEFLEIKTVIEGKIVVRDDQGKKYVATEGDVFIFTPHTTVVFDAESDGKAIYSAHRAPEDSML